MIIKCIGIAFICLFFVSCNIGICTWNIGYSQIESKPKDNDLIGKYFLDENSKAKYIDEGLDTKYAKLELKADHQYVLVDAPNVILNKSDWKQTFIKAGRWSVSCDESYGCVIELEGVCVVPMSKKDDIFSVPIGMGDPDQCEGIVFVKSN
jgi:hypothetical protein